MMSSRLRMAAIASAVALALAGCGKGGYAANDSAAANEATPSGDAADQAVGAKISAYTQGARGSIIGDDRDMRRSRDPDDLNDLIEACYRTVERANRVDRRLMRGKGRSVLPYGNPSTRPPSGAPRAARWSIPAS